MNNQTDFVLPALYDKFLSEMGEDGKFLIENTGITLYSKADLVESNTTYQIEEWEPAFSCKYLDGEEEYTCDSVLSDIVGLWIKELTGMSREEIEGIF